MACASVVRSFPPASGGRPRRGFSSWWLGAGVFLVVQGLLLSPAVAAKPRAKKAAVADTDAPVITHTPLSTCPSSADGSVLACEVTAEIVDESGVFDPTLLIRLYGATAYDRVVMKAGPEAPSLYRAEIPRTLVAAGDVEYLIEAFDLLGNGPARVGQEETPLLVTRPTPSTTTTTTTTTTTPPPNGGGTTEVPPSESDDDGGLILGVAIGAGVLVALAAGIGVAAAVYAFREPAPSELTVTVSGPAPFAAVVP